MRHQNFCHILKFHKEEEKSLHKEEEKKIAQYLLLNETENNAINTSLDIQSQKVKIQHRLYLPVKVNWSHPRNQQIFYNSETSWHVL